MCVIMYLLQMKCESFKFHKKCFIILCECYKNVENMNLSLTLKKFGHIQVKSGDNYRIITDVVYRAQLPLSPLLQVSRTTMQWVRRDLHRM